MLTWLTKYTYRQAKRIVILIVGVSVVLIGLIMIVLPGPGLLVIPLGLAILATEFVWARLILKRLKDYYSQVRNSVFGPKNGGPNNTSTEERPSPESNQVVVSKPAGK